MNGFLNGIGLGLVVLGTLALGFISSAVGLILLDKLDRKLERSKHEEKSNI